MPYKLDLKDRKLLYELDLDSRQSFNKLAKKIGLSKNATIYRINKLKKAAIIKQFHTVLDIGKLGLIGFRLYLRLQNASPEKHQEIIAFLAKKETVSWIVSIEGEYDIGVLILAKSTKEMSKLWKELLEKYVNYIEKRFLAIMSKVSYFSRAYLANKKNNDYEIAFSTESNPQKLDKTDLHILKLLAHNSRDSVVSIASKTRITPKTVIQRIKILEKKGVIAGYKTVFDLEKLGYKYYKVNFLLNNVTKEKVKSFRNFIKNHPNIVYDDQVLGGDDLEIELQVKDSEELRKIILEIQKSFSSIIKSYSILEFFKEHKYLFFPGTEL